MRVIKFFVRILVPFSAFAGAGLLIGLAIWWANHAGYFERWHELPSPTFKVIELISVGAGDVYARTSDDLIYRCTNWLDECWVRDQVRQEVVRPVQITKPCNFASPDFFLLGNAPRSVLDCVQDITGSGEGAAVYSTYVLDDSGSVWMWEHYAGGVSSFGWMIIFASLGTLTGSLVGIKWLTRNK